MQYHYITHTVNYQMEKFETTMISSSDQFQAVFFYVYGSYSLTVLVTSVHIPLYNVKQNTNILQY